MAGVYVIQTEDPDIRFSSGLGQVSTDSGKLPACYTGKEPYKTVAQFNRYRYNQYRCNGYSRLICVLHIFTFQAGVDTADPFRSSYNKYDPPGRNPAAPLSVCKEVKSL